MCAEAARLRAPSRVGSMRARETLSRCLPRRAPVPRPRPHTQDARAHAARHRVRAPSARRRGRRVVLVSRRRGVAGGGVTIQETPPPSPTHTYAAHSTTARAATGAASRRATCAHCGANGDGSGKCDGRALLGRRTRDSIG